MTSVNDQSAATEQLPTPNLPLLRKVLDHIDAHPEEWNQREWASRTSCGTAYCIAGHALTMHGFQVSSFGVDDSEQTVDALAREVLGLTRAESGNGCGNSPGIFCSENTRADVQRHAEAIATRGGERL